MTKENVIMGLWKFREPATTEQLNEVAQDWHQTDPNYISLAIRPAGEHELAIAFAYKVTGGASVRDAQKQYRERVSGILKDRFGSLFVGWDLGSPVDVIL
jgi:hypothetical protein